MIQYTGNVNKQPNVQIINQSTFRLSSLIILWYRYSVKYYILVKFISFEIFGKLFLLNRYWVWRVLISTLVVHNSYLNIIEYTSFHQGCAQVSFDFTDQGGGGSRTHSPPMCSHLLVMIKVKFGFFNWSLVFSAVSAAYYL